MAPLLKTLLGNGSKDRELTDEMRTVLQEIRQERSHCETLVKSARTWVTKLQELSAPVAKAQGDTDAMTGRLSDLERRLETSERLATRFQALAEHAEQLGQGQRQAEARIGHATEDAKRIRSQLEELSHQVEMALDLKERLGGFLEMEIPFRKLQADAETLRGQMDGTGEQLTRLREQHDRVMDAHKVAMSKVDAVDQRHEELARGVQDKERRLGVIEQSLRGLDDVRETVEDAKHRLGTLKALGDYVAQKTAALEAQREALEQATERADQLELAMRQIDAGLRQQQEYGKTLTGLRDELASVHALHGSVMQRAREVDEVQRDSDEQIRAVRQELTTARDNVRKAVERFEFENRGLESVNQRVVDLRATLADFEGRFADLNEAAQLVTSLGTQTSALTTQLQTLAVDAGRLDDETRKVQAIRRDLDEASRTARETGERLARVDEARPAIEAALRDVEQLRSAHTAVKDTLEQSRVAGAEIARIRESQSQTRTWLATMQESLDGVQERAEELRRMGPTLEFVQKQVQRVNESQSVLESRREFVEELHRRLTELGALGGKLDERGRDLETRMEGAEQRFVGLTAQADEAERLGKAMAGVTAELHEAGRDAEQVRKSVAAVEARCESVEGLAERTQMLRQELEQRQHALEEASNDLQRASTLRQEAAAAAQDLDERAKRLTGAVATAERQATRVESLSSQLEDRADNLRFVEKRLGQFEERIGRWELVEQEIGRSLEQLAARHTTVESLQADVDRMFVVAEKTAADVRAITSAQGEIAESRAVLEDVMDRLREVRELASGLDERKRQTGQAEDRLARAEALLIDIRSSVETLQGQKAIVDQAVERTGALRFLLKQAEAMIEGLREERDMTSRVRAAIATSDDEDAVRAEWEIANAG